MPEDQVENKATSNVKDPIRWMSGLSTDAWQMQHGRAYIPKLAKSRGRLKAQADELGTLPRPPKQRFVINNRWEDDGTNIYIEAEGSTSQEINLIGELNTNSLALTIDESLTSDFSELDPSIQSMIPLLSLSDMDSLDIYCSQLTNEQKFELAKNFAATANLAFPLFQQQSFLNQLASAEAGDTLPFLIYAISIKLVGTAVLTDGLNIDKALQEFANSVPKELSSVTSRASLSRWRSACLLTWYGFHQYPGKDEGVGVALLTRQAYQHGLHQIDSVDNRRSFGWDRMDDDLLEDWRHIWWCIFILDSYANFSTATPYQVETESLRTALPQSPQLSEATHTSSTTKLFLPTNLTDLWRIVQTIGSSSCDKSHSIDLAFNVLLKEIITVHRRHKQNPCPSIGSQLSALEDHLSAVKLALPSNYMLQSQDVMGGESEASYHCRLVTLLKLYGARLLSHLPLRLLDEDQWQARWRESLHICFQMFTIIQQWDTRYILVVDPAVCFIMLPLLVLLHLHSLYDGVSNLQLHDQLSRRKDVVRLIIEGYAKYWTLSRFLLGCYDAFLKRVPGPLNAEDVNQILDQFQGPLHRKWLGFLGVSLPGDPFVQTLDPTYSEHDTSQATADEIDAIEDSQSWTDFLGS
ncbi:hypothetical protein PT974_03120 [Cladobotryum mycophilum]|uniref:Xylanolytic transcriptional activator regulatory domain-containing protein n=1 Tax=Cladobotryum mycophilum TaxID=491253 RepID=A0ABR0SRD8_9HYPO